MKTFVSADDLRRALKTYRARTVWVEVDADLLCALMGQRFNGPDGVVSMEQVSLYREDNGMLVAQPAVLRQR